MSAEKEIKNNERLGKLETEVHLLTSGFTELKDLIGKLFSKLEDHQKETTPRPISFPVMLSMAVSLIVILGGMFATVIYIANSSNAPIVAQQNQILNTMNTIISSQTSLSSNIQLANKDISVIKNKSQDNAETLQWILFEENIPKQTNNIKKDIEYIKRDLSLLLQNAHKKRSK